MIPESLHRIGDFRSGDSYFLSYGEVGDAREHVVLIAFDACDGYSGNGACTWICGVRYIRIDNFILRKELHA